MTALVTVDENANAVCLINGEAFIMAWGSAALSSVPQMLLISERLQQSPWCAQHLAGCPDRHIAPNVGFLGVPV